MPSNPKYPDVAERDGTSQTGRALDALAPDYVQVDEQTSEDLLGFARGYGAELVYYDATNTVVGDWSGFVGADLDLPGVADFLRDPQKFSAATSPDFYRPHFVLFLTFLKLLEQSRAELNQLTARHLDYYYRQILRMVGRPSIPDRVNLIANLAPSSSQVLVKAGSLLSAGPDSAGRDRIYATDQDLVVNRAQISKLSSLFIERRRTTLRQVPQRFPNDTERATEALFQIALGNPLPLYADGSVVDYAKLISLRASLDRSESDFYLSISELRDLETRKSLRPAAPAEWDAINTYIEAAGNRKRGDSSFHLDHSSTDFYNNVTLAVGVLSFGTLPQVTILDDLADLRTRDDVATFIKTQVYFDNVDDFASMIQLKRKFTSDWAGINGLIELAGQRKRNDATYQLSPTDVTDFSTNVQNAIGVSLTTLQQYWSDVQALEAYFYLPAELFAFVMDEVVNNTEDNWRQCFDILEQAHKDQLRQERQNELQAMREATPPARLVDLIRFVLGETPDASDDATAADRLVPYIGQDDSDKLSGLETTGDWTRIYSLLELAERNRLGEPSAESLEWMNLYPAIDATKVAPARSMQDADSASSPRFAAFGDAQPLPTATPAPNPVLGWALSSPQLVLSEGVRTITLTLGFSSTKTALADIFLKEGTLSILFQISTAKGFIACTASTPVFGDYATLCAGSAVNSPQGVKFVITLPATVDPIVAPPAALVDDSSPWPVLRLLMQPIWSADYEEHIARYPELSELELLATYLQVEVSGLRAIRVQSDDTTLDAKRPFEPFGRTPMVGSRFLIGHPEIVAKRLDSLRFDFQWIGAPDNLSTYYANYGIGSPTFTAKLSLVDGAQLTTLSDAAPLFASGTSLPSIAIDKTPFTQARDVLPDPLAEAASDLDSDLTNWPRYVQWELNSPDFQHTAYSTVATTKAQELALAIAKATSTSSVTVSDYSVPPPYTPKLKTLTVGYSSSLELRFDNLLRDGSVHRVRHIHPFGACDVETERTGLTVPFLAPYENDGELYIGLTGLVPAQVVSIFIQVAEGSADANLTPQPISWSCLDNDRWVALDSQVLSDSTRGLCNSGIISLSLPVTQPSTRIRGDYYWLRATMVRDTASICDIVGVYTQGLSATFVDHNNASDHFANPLPAGSITQLAKRLPQIASISQPYTSYGGRMAEAADMFNTRVSERLRHKARALSIWDYERLILDQFPELHKVKCIPATPDAPGKLTIIVIPDIRNKLPFEPFAPKAPANLLADITDYVTARAPASADLTVKNAEYVAVRVRLGVRFRGTGNEAFYKQQLIDELNRFLSPWAYDEGADVAIGGRIYASSIVDFVDRRDYVDYVAGIKLFHSEDGETFRPVTAPASTSSDPYYVGTDSPDSVLVAARTHQIDVLSTADYEEKLVTGIGFMKLELDFVVVEG